MPQTLASTLDAKQNSSNISQTSNIDKSSTVQFGFNNQHTLKQIKYHKCLKTNNKDINNDSV